MTRSKPSIITDHLKASSMDEITVALTIHHLTKDEADQIFDAALNICERTLSGSMQVEIYKKPQKTDGIGEQ